MKMEVKACLGPMCQRRFCITPTVFTTSPILTPISAAVGFLARQAPLAIRYGHHDVQQNQGRLFLSCNEERFMPVGSRNDAVVFCRQVIHQHEAHGGFVVDDEKRMRHKVDGLSNKRKRWASVLNINGTTGNPLQVC